MNTKICKKCGKTKLLDDFYTDPSRTDGHHPYCKECKCAMQRVPFELRERTRSVREGIRHRNHKVCACCGQDMPLSSFYQKSRYPDGHDYICKDCDKKKHKESYDPVKAKCYSDSRKEVMAHNTAGYRNHLKKELIIRLGGKCSRCGLPLSDQYPVCCFDFHHSGDSNKETRMIRRMGVKRNRQAVIEEVVNQCTVLCSNCHRIAHFKYPSA